MKLRIGRGEIDQIIGMRENGAKPAALPMIKKSADFLAPKWPCEPLHVVLHKNLHRSAVNGTRALDRAMYAAADRHVGAEQNSRSCHFERSEAESRNAVLTMRDVSTSLDMTRLSKPFRMPVRVVETAFTFVFEKLVHRQQHDTGAVGVDSHVEIQSVVEEMDVAVANHSEKFAGHMESIRVRNAVLDCKTGRRVMRDAVTDARHNVGD